MSKKLKFIFFGDFDELSPIKMYDDHFHVTV